MSAALPIAFKYTRMISDCLNEDSVNYLYAQHVCIYLSYIRVKDNVRI